MTWHPDKAVQGPHSGITVLREFFCDFSATNLTLSYFSQLLVSVADIREFSTISAHRKLTISSVQTLKT